MGRMSFTQELKALRGVRGERPRSFRAPSRHGVECYAIVSIATSNRSAP